MLEATRSFEHIGYRGALLSTLLHAAVYVFLHNLLNVLVQIKTKTTKLRGLICEQTIPTERQKFVGEVSANFCGERGVA
jgi:hypothetical protein